MFLKVDTHTLTGVTTRILKYMAITPKEGWMVDPNNPNGVIPIGSASRSLSSTDSSSTNLNQFKEPDDTALRALSGEISPEKLAQESKTIMERFAARKANVMAQEEAQAGLIKSQAEETIGEQRDINQRELTSEQEAQRGFAQNTALVRSISETGEKRIRRLEKTRDELLLQNKYEAAGRLDQLITDEETAITTARKNWLDSLIAFTTESRAISAERRAEASFETPEQARQRQLTVDTTKQIQQLALVAPDAGITSADSYDTAVKKYRESGTYKLNQRTAEAQLQQIQASTAASRASEAKARKEMDAIGASEVITTSPLGQSKASAYTNALSNVTGKSSVFTQKSKKAELATYLANGNEDAARSMILTSAIDALPAEQATDIIKRRQALDSLREVKELLNSYVEETGKTNLLRGTIDNAIRSIGFSTDPRAQEVQTRITTALQSYRNAVTGAAWGPQETAEYKAILPDIRNTNTLNMQKIDALTGVFEDFDRSALSVRLGGDFLYDTIFGETSASGGAGPTGSPADTTRTLSSTPFQDLGNNLFGGLLTQ